MRLHSARDLKLSLVEQLRSRPGAVLSPRSAAAALGALNLLLDACRQASLAIGIARRGRTGDYRLAVRVQQRPLEATPVIEALARRARGEVEVRYVGRIRPGAAAPAGARWPRTPVRPLIIGASVGHAAVTAGTLGFFARDRRGRLGLVSNTHILARENAAAHGEPILQPAPIDGGRLPRHAVARLERYVRLRTGRSNAADAALAIINPGIAVDPHTLRGLGRLREPLAGLELGTIVYKLGRTTGLTRGHISAIELDNVFVDYGLGRVRFDDQFEIEGVTGRSGRPRSRPFSLGGDSGALVVDGDGHAAALLFAGSDHGGAGDHGLSYATPIAAVLDALRIKLEL